jgi:hypothetical protein
VEHICGHLSFLEKCALTRGVASLEINSLVVFYYFSASEIRHVKRSVLTRGGLLNIYW